MSLDVISKWLWKGFLTWPTLKTCDYSKPIVQGSLSDCSIISDFLFIVTDYLNECTHNVREKCNPHEHYYEAEYHLVWCLRCHVSITGCSQGNYREIASGNESILISSDILLVKVCGNKWIFLVGICNIDIERYHVPNVACKVDNDSSDDYQSEDLIRVH